MSFFHLSTHTVLTIVHLACFHVSIISFLQSTTKLWPTRDTCVCIMHSLNAFVNSVRICTNYLQMLKNGSRLLFHHFFILMHPTSSFLLILIFWPICLPFNHISTYKKLFQLESTWNHPKLAQNHLESTQNHPRSIPNHFESIQISHNISNISN